MFRRFFRSRSHSDCYGNFRPRAHGLRAKSDYGFSVRLVTDFFQADGRGFDRRARIARQANFPLLARKNKTMA